MRKVIPRPLQIVGDTAIVPLTKGYFAVIDAADADVVGRYNWSALLGKSTVYATAATMGKHVYLHRLLTKAPTYLHVDHVDSDGLNNRRSNLRLCTRSQNKHNQRVRRDSSTGVKGVYSVKGRYVARIYKEGRNVGLGTYDTVEEASAAYMRGATALFGSFARAG